MASKALLLLGFFAFVLVLSEMAAAADSQSDTVKGESEETVQPDHYDGGRGYGGKGGGKGGYKGRGGYSGGGRGKGRGGGGGYCRHGCCYKGYHGCSKCCSYAGEAVETQPEH